MPISNELITKNNHAMSLRLYKSILLDTNLVNNPIEAQKHTEYVIKSYNFNNIFFMFHPPIRDYSTILLL